MDWLQRMNAALDYIEENLAKEIKLEIVAQKAGCSVFHFQRMFSFHNRHSFVRVYKTKKINPCST
ncbi:hypothetical protein RZN22_11845 [Bacillaceae bacterium S4-13-58]